MTTLEERTRSVVQTREFLLALCCPARTPRVPNSIRREAECLLRHYPMPGDLDFVAAALPMWWAPGPGRPQSGAPSYILTRELGIYASYSKSLRGHEVWADVQRRRPDRWVAVDDTTLDGRLVDSGRLHLRARRRTRDSPPPEVLVRPAEHQVRRHQPCLPLRRGRALPSKTTIASFLLWLAGPQSAKLRS